MGKCGKTPEQQVVELLRAKGIIISEQEAEQLLATGSYGSDITISESFVLQLLQEPRKIRGYKVYVEYKKISIAEMFSKQQAVARIIGSSIKKLEK